jgi:hypothetical protein
MYLSGEKKITMSVTLILFLELSKKCIKFCSNKLFKWSQNICVILGLQSQFFKGFLDHSNIFFFSQEVKTILETTVAIKGMI